MAPNPALKPKSHVLYRSVCDCTMSSPNIAKPKFTTKQSTVSPRTPKNTILNLGLTTVSSIKISHSSRDMNIPDPDQNA